MGYLKVHKLIYRGDNYYYESPELSDGINIIEGENGSGKSTFSNLLSYSLGNYVKEFDYNKKNDKVHKEIVGDTNNYVLTTIYIDNRMYTLKRIFRDNKIFISDNDETEVLHINRSATVKYIFSDWLLEKLKIPVIEYYQGSKNFKLNFSDLFRLMYYDQKTEPEKIYKDARISGNFISDSEFIRKVIFQILMGHEFSEYYKKIGELNEKKREKESLSGKAVGFSEIAKEFGYKDLTEVNINHLHDLMHTKKLQSDRLEVYENELLSKRKHSINLIDTGKRYKNELLNIELDIEKNNHMINRLYREMKNIRILKKSVMLEVTQLQKIIITHEELNLFSPNTCPYCQNEVHRKEGHCICGHEINESEYEKFFYTTNEYLAILKSKNKSLETLDLALESCNEELLKLQNIVEKSMEKKKDLKKLIDLSIEDSIEETNMAAINDLQKKKYDIKVEINNIEQYAAVKTKYEKLINQINLIDNYISKSQSVIKHLERSANKEMDIQVQNFSEIYNDFLVDIKDDINKAQINSENYMPKINDGEYREASIDVTVKLMYFVTLLKIAIENINVPYPRFLLIDTPESKGIDPKNLNQALSKFLELEKIEGTKFQVILTSGKDKYPKVMQKYKKGRSLTTDQKLLKRTESNS